MHNPFSLTGKTVLITGASSGIGKITAIECSKLGANVIITARDPKRLLETFNLLERIGQNHQYFIADLTKNDDVENLLNAIPILDGISNNAGIGNTLPLHFFSLTELDRIYRINCFHPILLLKQLIKKKKLRKMSSVVFTSSIAGSYNILPGNGIYGAAKSSLDALMKYAALELSSKKIRCNSVNPGIINTPFIEKNKSISTNNLKEELEKYPLGRYGEAMDVAYAIIFLLSDTSSWITGTNLVIDGGRSLK